MFQRFHQRFGTAGLVIAVIALIAALGGTALAASGALTGKQKKEVEKIAKKYAGKPGAPGANGTNGTNGAPGAKGDIGATGLNGTDGTNGTNGKSVVIGATAPGCGVPNGKTIEVAGEPATKQNVCNGKEGSPWTPGTLPEKATETGSWSFSGKKAGASAGILPTIASFAIPLEAPLAIGNVHFVTVEEWKEENEKTPPSACLGTSEEPKATPGSLCVYESKLVGASFVNFLNPGVSPIGIGAGTTGTVGLFGVSGDEHEEYVGYGTWAVTGAEA